MYTGSRCGGGLNFYPNVYTLVREEVSASAGTTRHICTHTRPRVYMHTRVNEHIDERARVRGWILPPLSFAFSLSPYLSLPIARGSGKARIRSAVNLKINIDRGAANPLFIDADCWLHGRETRQEDCCSPPSYHPQHPLGFRCHVVPNASWIMRSSSLQSLFRPSCYSPLRFNNESYRKKCE